MHRRFTPSPVEDHVIMIDSIASSVRALWPVYTCYQAFDALENDAPPHVELEHMVCGIR